jgi:hypothetical protein
MFSAVFSTVDDQLYPVVKANTRELSEKCRALQIELDSRFPLFPSCHILLERSLRVASTCMALARLSAGLLQKALPLDQGPTLPREVLVDLQLFLSEGSQSSATPSGGCESISLTILGRPLKHPTQLSQPALLEQARTEIERSRSSLPFAPP